VSEQPLDPIRTSIVVDAPVDRAFDIFAEELGRWWPPAYTYAQGQFATARIEPHPGGRWFERAKDGRETSWGEVRSYEPPHRLVLSFAVSPMRTPEPPGKASEVQFRFIAEDASRTRVEVEHRDFARHGDGAMRLREGMASQQGWPLILAAYARTARA
jgi:uncharacterized protein YndB with AHSA1/START domain